MEREVAWKKYDAEAKAELEALAASYIDFISQNKTERECAKSAIELAESFGYQPLETLITSGSTLKPGDKIWAHAQGKALMLIQLGSAPLERGLNILGAHIDSPRLDLKQNPLYESQGFAFLDTHYYGGIKKYQWLALPLAIHGVVAKSDGTIVEITIGEAEDDPVFCITDLLPHLASEQMEKKASAFVEGESLDVLIGNEPARAFEDSEGSEGSEDLEDLEDSDGSGDSKDPKDSKDKKDTVKARMLQWLKERYDLDEEDFLSAELEVVPAGKARELGFDRSMILGYGQDDRVCAYTSLVAQLALASETLERTAVTILVDKEEIGSVGASGMTSRFFENTLAEIFALSGVDSPLALRRCLSASSMLSSDVSAGFDPSYAGVYEEKNTAFLGRGLVFNKYTGARGKSGSNDARAEYMARIRSIMDTAQVSFQTSELGKVDAGGGGTIAYIPAEYGMDVIDSGVPVLSMHSPWEVTSKADVYEARKGYEAFLRNA